MSNVITPDAPVTAAPVVPAEPIHQSPKDALPSGLKIDSKHSADGFFEAHKAANDPNKPAPAVPIVPVEVKPDASVAAPDNESSPAKGSLAEKLSAKTKVAAPVDAKPSAAPTVGKNPEDEITLDPKYSPSASESFNKIKTVAVGLREQLNAAREAEKHLKEQLASAKTVAPAPETEEVDRLRAEHKAMSDRLALVDLREHPKFQAEFVDPQNQALTDAAALLAANGIQNADLAVLLAKPRSELGKAVSELTKDLPDFDRVEFSENIRKAYALKQSADSALVKSKDIYAAMRSQTVEGQRKAFQETWSRVAGDLNSNMVEIDIPETLGGDAREAAEAYNSELRGIQSKAEKIAFATTSPAEVSQNAIKAAAYDFHIKYAQKALLADFQRLLDVNKGLTKEIQSIRGRNPNFQLGGSAGNGSSGAGPDGTLSAGQLAKMSHAEAAAALAPRR